MRLEAGKKYTDRRGRVFGPLVRDGVFYAEQVNCPLWSPNGQIDHDSLDMDLVAEYAEPVQAEYRMLQDGEVVQDGDEYCGWSGIWEKSPVTGGVFKSLLHHRHRRLVEPAPVESPDDWVILDPVVYADHVPRVGIDQFQGWDNQWTTQGEFNSKETIGRWHASTGGSQTRCRRKDLPAEPEFPEYIIYATGGAFADCAYIVRTSEDDAYSVLVNGKRDVDFKWMAYKTEMLKSGFWKRVTEQEAEKLVSRTRTVVLKEWLCWDDEYPDHVCVGWCGEAPSTDRHQFEAFDHAHETGNTRTVEIPVT